MKFVVRRLLCWSVLLGLLVSWVGILLISLDAHSRELGIFTAEREVVEFVVAEEQAIVHAINREEKLIAHSPIVRAINHEEKLIARTLRKEKRRFAGRVRGALGLDDDDDDEDDDDARARQVERSPQDKPPVRVAAPAPPKAPAPPEAKAAPPPAPKPLHTPKPGAAAIHVRVGSQRATRRVACDLPCFWSPSRSGVVLRGTIEEIDTAFVASMEGEQYYASLKLTHDPNVMMSTTSFESDVPLPYFSYAEYVIQKPHVKLRDVERKKAVFVARNCASKNDREGLVRSLMELLPVESVSSCLHNADVPGSRGSKVDLVRRYALYLAFENQNVDDYVTEKLWGALDAGVLPVYYGAPNVWQNAPPGSIVNVRDFPSTEALAAHLRAILANETLYESYHAWRYRPLPAWWVARFEITRTHSECRTCLWADARREQLRLAGA